MSKRVLLIARAYYPSTFAGSHRVAKFAKYLPKFGWTPVVLTADWNAENSSGCYDAGLAAQPDVCKVVRVPYQVPRSRSPASVLLHLTELIWPYEAPFRFTRDMLNAAEALGAREPFDVIWSTFASGLAHYVADRVSRKYGLPWVADFRDLPDQASDSWSARRAVKAETQVCVSARALTVTCRPQADKLASRHRAPVSVIPNGFDPEDYPPAGATRSDLFTVAYFGILYAYRDPVPLFAALDLLADKGDIDPNDVRVRFYGSNAGFIQSRLAGHRCGRMVECCPRVPVNEMLRLEQAAVVLLLLKSPEAGGSVPSKLFEYMAAGRPILNVPGDGDVVDAILGETRAGLSAAQPADIARVLKLWYDEWKRAGWVAGKGIPDKVALYSREVQARQLAEILDSLST
jgi:glycosyltransferase involved in cell wall biosynthesis